MESNINRITDILRRDDGISGAMMCTININDIKEFDISAKNPNNIEVIEHKSPIKLVENIKGNNKEINDLMDETEAILIGKDIK